MDEHPRSPAGETEPPAAGAWDVDGLHEGALRELLRSPLDDEPEGTRGGTRPGRWAATLLFVAAALAGAGVTVAVAALAGDDGPAAVIITTTTTTEVAPPGPALPAGYHPLGHGFGGRVERILQRPDGVFVTLSLAVDEEHDPRTTTGHQGGQWVLEFPDGTTVLSSAVAFDPVARATATIVFPAFEQDPTPATLRLVSAEEIHSAVYSARVAGTVPALPVAGTLSLTLEPATLALEDDGTLRLGALTLGPAGASLEWTVEGIGVTAHVNPVVVMEGPTTAVLLLDDPFHPFRNRVLSVPPPGRATSGRVDLIPLDPTTTDPGADFALTATFEVTWSVSAPADAALPLAGAVRVEIRTNA